MVGSLVERGPVSTKLRDTGRGGGQMPKLRDQFGEVLVAPSDLERSGGGAPF